MRARTAGAILAASLLPATATLARADVLPQAPPPAVETDQGTASRPPTVTSRPWSPLLVTPPLTAGLQPLEVGQHFTVDPVSDGVLIGGGAAISILLSLILTTGEIKPTLPGPASNLLWIDRLAVTQHIDPNAATLSTVGLGAAIGFAVLDPFLSAQRDGWDAFVVDAVMYAETASLTETLTDITKIAVRRPRPIDYVNCPAGTTSAACTENTDLQLSFFSGHASTVGAIGATASYLAFQRGGSRSARAWITLATSISLTTFVSIERVRAGEHFPTDVIAGALAGGMVGVLVPHLHRHAQEAPTLWIGFAPMNGGASGTLSGTF